MDEFEFEEIPEDEGSGLVVEMNRMLEERDARLLDMMRSQESLKESVVSVVRECEAMTAGDLGSAIEALECLVGAIAKVSACVDSQRMMIDRLIEEQIETEHDFEVAVRAHEAFQDSSFLFDD